MRLLPHISRRYMVAAIMGAGLGLWMLYQLSYPKIVYSDENILGAYNPCATGQYVAVYNEAVFLFFAGECLKHGLQFMLWPALGAALFLYRYDQLEERGKGA